MFMDGLRLIFSRRFGYFFTTQFLGAFNDNFLKNAVVILITFNYAQKLEGISEGILVNLCLALLILPFFLFSSLAGQISDKYEKSFLIKWIKIFEIIIMAIASIGLYFDILFLQMLTIFLTGLQSTMFGPIKYSILPQHLEKSELLSGNAIIETATFLAILLGTIAGGVLGKTALVLGLMLCSVLGYLACLRIPSAPSSEPDLKINWNIFSSTVEIIKQAKVVDSVFYSIMGISWFWFLGSILLSQIPGFVLKQVNGVQEIATLYLATFCFGIGFGSFICEKLSRGKTELGLVPIGAFGMSLFLTDIFIVDPHITSQITLETYFNHPSLIRVLIDLMMISISGGVFIVPLYTIIQERSDDAHRSRIIASNNIINSLFMVVSALMAMALLHQGVSIPGIFLVVAIQNVIVSLFIFSLVPEFTLRFLSWMLVHTIYRLRYQNTHHVPEEGPAVITCNHISYVDGLIISAAIRRPIRFVVDHKIAKMPGIKQIYQVGRFIPICSFKEDAEKYAIAFQEIKDALDNGELIGIFPEGKLTADGEMNSFRKGIEKIIEANPVPIVPMAICGLWGSFFTRQTRGPLALPKKLFAKLELKIGSPLSPQGFNAQALEATIRDLRGDRA